MASAAVPETVRQISPAIPLGALAGIRLKGAPIEKQDIPAGDETTKVERKNQIVGGSGAANCRSAHQERIDRTNIVIGSMREMIIGESRIKMPAFPIDALAHRTRKRHLRPRAYAGFGIRCDVGRKDRPERSGKRQTSRQRLAGIGRVASAAAADRSQVRAATDGLVVIGRCFAGGKIGAIAERQVHASPPKAMRTSATTAPITIERKRM